jgi:hypothetical protein
VFIPLVSFQGFSQTSYKIKKKWDGSYEVTDTRAAQRMLIQGAYNSAPKFKSYRVSPSSNKSSSRNTTKIIVLNQSEKSYASKNNSNITNETKKSDNSDDYKSVKTYSTIPSAIYTTTISKKERLEANQKKIDIKYEFNYQSINNLDISLFLVSYSNDSERYWGKIIDDKTRTRMYTPITPENRINKLNGFIKSINEYSDFGEMILEYPMIKQKQYGTSSKYYVKPIKNENKVKALALEDEDLLYRYNKLNDEYEQFGNWYRGKFEVFRNKRNKAKKLQSKLNEVIAEINSKYDRANKQYLVIEYGSGLIGHYNTPSKYIKIKKPNGRVLYEAIYKNYSMIELVEELFVN